MSKEHEHQPSPHLDLETVSNRARETALANSGHRPMLIVEGDQQAVVVEFEELGETHEDRVQQMQQIGFRLSQDKQISVPRQIFFVSEGWMSLPKDEEVPTVPPSQDPNRIEVLIISNLDIRQRQAGAMIWEMIRDDEARLTDLTKVQIGEDTPEQGTIASPLLTAFVHGYAMGLSGPHD